MKKVIVGTVGLCAIAALSASYTMDAEAHSKSFDNNHCNINIDGDFKFAERTLTISTTKDEVVTITPNYEVFVDGKALDLNKTETSYVKSYYDGIEQTIPQVMTVAAEGVKIANYAVSEVLRGFLGKDSKVADTFQGKLDELYSGLQSHVYQHPDYVTFDSQKLESDLGFGPDFEAEIDAMVSEVMEQAMGEFFVQLGRNMMSGEGSMESFETRMENMGDEISAKVEGKTEAIEREAEKLCDMLSEVDSTEGKMQQIKGLKALDLLLVSKNV